MEEQATGHKFLKVDPNTQQFFFFFLMEVVKYSTVQISIKIYLKRGIQSNRVPLIRNVTTRRLCKKWLLKDEGGDVDKTADKQYEK